MIHPFFDECEQQKNEYTNSGWRIINIRCCTHSHMTWCYAVYSGPLNEDDSNYDECSDRNRKDIYFGDYSTVEELLVVLSAFFTEELGGDFHFTSVQNMYDECYINWQFRDETLLFDRSIYVVVDGETMLHDSELKRQHDQENIQWRQARLNEENANIHARKQQKTIEKHKHRACKK